MFLFPFLIMSSFKEQFIKDAMSYAGIRIDNAIIKLDDDYYSFLRDII